MNAKSRRRSRGEIDRRFLLADILIKAGAIALLFVAVSAAATPFGIEGALQRGLGQYVAVMTGFAVVGLALLMFGRHLRRETTHFDRD